MPSKGSRVWNRGRFYQGDYHFFVLEQCDDVNPSSNAEREYYDLVEIYQAEGVIHDTKLLADYLKYSKCYPSVDLNNAVLLHFKKFERLLVFLDSESTAESNEMKIGDLSQSTNVRARSI